MGELLELRPARKVVLIVDDDPTVGSDAADMFEDLGYVVLRAGGHDALDVLRRRRDISLVFTDGRSLGVRGAALADQARYQHLGVQVLLGLGSTRPRPQTSGVAPTSCVA